MWTHHVLIQKGLKVKEITLAPTPIFRPPSFYASVYTTNNYYNFKEKNNKKSKRL